MFSLKLVFSRKMDLEKTCFGGRSVKKPSELSMGLASLGYFCGGM
jgi:hypothetical protein